MFIRKENLSGIIHYFSFTTELALTLSCISPPNPTPLPYIKEVKYIYIDSKGKKLTPNKGKQFTLLGKEREHTLRLTYFPALI